MFFTCICRLTARAKLREAQRLLPSGSWVVMAWALSGTAVV